MHSTRYEVQPYEATMRANLVTIGTDGSISGLQVKPGKGFDISKLGRAQIRRASEILWSDDDQAWTVEVRQGRFTGQTITDTLWHGIGLSEAPRAAAGLSKLGVLLFDTYEAAVDAEIQFLDHVRLTKGPDALR